WAPAVRSGRGYRAGSRGAGWLPAVAAAGARGRRAAATRPTRAITASRISGAAYELPGLDPSWTIRMVPAIAAPREEPRFDTLRDRPEISPWRSSGKLDCTRLTDGVSITPRPS